MAACGFRSVYASKPVHRHQVDRRYARCADGVVDGQKFSFFAAPGTVTSKRGLARVPQHVYLVAFGRDQDFLGIYHEFG